MLPCPAHHVRSPRAPLTPLEYAAEGRFRPVGKDCSPATLSWLALCTLYNKSASQLVTMQRDPHSFEKRRGARDLLPLWGSQIGRASCRERVLIFVGDVLLKK